MLRRSRHCQRMCCRSWILCTSGIRIRRPEWCRRRRGAKARRKCRLACVDAASQTTTGKPKKISTALSSFETTMDDPAGHLIFCRGMLLLPLHDAAPPVVNTRFRGRQQADRRRSPPGFISSLYAAAAFSAPSAPGASFLNSKSIFPPSLRFIPSSIEGTHDLSDVPSVSVIV